MENETEKPPSREDIKPYRDFRADTQASKGRYAQAELFEALQNIQSEIANLRRANFDVRPEILRIERDLQALRLELVRQAETIAREAHNLIPLGPLPEDPHEWADMQEFRSRVVVALTEQQREELHQVALAHKTSPSRLGQAAIVQMLAQIRAGAVPMIVPSTLANAEAHPLYPAFYPVPGPLPEPRDG